MAELDELRVEIVDGIISNFKADVVVNSTNVDLYLNVGALSKAILRGAGKAIQEECDQKYPDGIALGKVAITAGYKLPCKKVYHGALPTWNPKTKNTKPRKLLCQFVCACLEQAHEDGATSIALPSLGCGFLNFPPSEVASSMSKCIAIFKNAHEETPLRTISIVVYTKGQDWRHTKQAFVNEMGHARIEEDQDKAEPRPGLARGNSFSAAKIGAAKADLLGKRVSRSKLREEEGKRRKVDPELVADVAKPGEIGLDAVDAGTSLDVLEPDEADEADAVEPEVADNACKQKLPCGHGCAGVKGEQSCPPCIQKDCPGHGDLKQAADDDCLICYTEDLAAAPSIQLSCGHMYHFHCVVRMLENKWVGTRITFNFMCCPMCKQCLEHPLLEDMLKPLTELKDEVRRKGMMRLQYEGLDKCDDVTKADSEYFEKPEEYAMGRYCYYPCFKCGQAYFGGIVQCDQGDREREFEAKEMICPACLNPDPKQSCDIHGNDELEYKCRYCCSVAIFYCHGTTHYCDICHRNWCKITGTPVNKLPKCPAGPNLKRLKGECPLNVAHPPTGTEFSLGCGICKNTQAF